MYGIIGVAVILGAGVHLLIKKRNVNTFFGTKIIIEDKPKTYIASIAGGTLFGLGWAMTGACPGPLYVLLGHGYVVIFFVILSALIGTWCYGMMRNKLPH
jgi:uncharacterized membrane protein YedE/YeeE